MVLVGFGVPLTQAMVDSIVSNFLLAACCLLIFNNMRFYLPRKEKYIYVIVLSATLVVLWFLSLRFILWLIYKNDAAYVSMLQLSTGLRISIAFLLTSSAAMISLTWHSERERTLLDNRKQETEKHLRQAELKSLRNQLQPHFLFNALNSIRALTIANPEKARKMIHQLSDFLRGSLRKDDTQMITLKEELEYLHLYLEIEKVRFGHRLETAIHIEAETLWEMKIPNMLLQPVMENAIKFGLYDSTGPVCISLNAQFSNNLLIIQVQNPYDPELALPLHGTGFGLRAVRERLALLFGRQDLVATQKNATDFITTISIPQS